MSVKSNVGQMLHKEVKLVGVCKADEFTVEQRHIPYYHHKKKFKFCHELLV